MTYFLFLFVIFAIAASLHEPGSNMAFGAFFMTAWIGLFSLVGYILLG